MLTMLSRQRVHGAILLNKNNDNYCTLLWVIPTTTQYSGIVSDISFGNGIYNRIISYIITLTVYLAFFLALNVRHLLWHTFWHLFWHSIWHLCRHSLRHSVWHSLWQACPAASGACGRVRVQACPQSPRAGRGRRRKKEEERRKKKEEEGRRRKKEEEGGRRICTFVTIYIETLTWQVGNSTIPTNIYSEFIRLYLLLLQPISPTVLPYSHVFTAYQ